MKSTSKLLAFLIAFCAPVLPSTAFAQEKGRVETSLLGLFPLGNASYQKFDDYYLVRGNIFDSAFVQHIYNVDDDGGSATYETNKQYDLFEADIATNCSSDSDQIRFYVLGDGKIIYRSRRLTNADKPLHISVPIKQYKAVTLATQAYYLGGLPNAVWADPKLVSTGRGQTQPVILPQTSPAFSARPTTQDTVALGRRSDGSYEVNVNGQTVLFGRVQPILKDGALLVPMRPLFEALGATVAFDTDSKVILARRGRHEVEMHLGSTSAYLDGKYSQLDAPAQNMLGTTLVPLRFIAEAFGAKITYLGFDN